MLECISEHACFGGVQGFYQHASTEIGLPMRFSVYQPPQVKNGPVPVLFYLAGLTCTEETFMIKAGAQRFAAQRFAAQRGIMLVAPDSPDVTLSTGFGPIGGASGVATINPTNPTGATVASNGCGVKVGAVKAVSTLASAYAAAMLVKLAGGTSITKTFIKK